MWIYEVSLKVDDDVSEAYELWLNVHMAEIVKAAGFQGARLYRVDGQEPGVKRWVTHYLASQRAQIDSYLENLAPTFRADGLARFGGKFSAERRILNLTVSL
jgi:hypothetical protein